MEGAKSTPSHRCHCRALLSQTVLFDEVRTAAFLGKPAAEFIVVTCVETASMCEAGFRDALLHHPDVVDHADAAVKNLKDLIDLHFRVLTAARGSSQRNIIPDDPIPRPLT